MDKNITSIEEMFRWKLNEQQCNEYQIEHIKHKSVEEENEDIVKKLKWNSYTDVLYSFLLTYKLGLEIINQDKFVDIKNNTKKNWGIKRLNTNSTMFLFLCSRDEAYKDFNDNPLNKVFLELYFTVGNVIPIWPGGNEARGKKGIYDIPELFFNTYPEWTEELIRQYNNICIDSIVKNDRFLVHRQNGTKEYKEPIEVDKLKDIMKKDNQVYYDYLACRNDIIKKRNSVLQALLKS